MTATTSPSISSACVGVGGGRAAGEVGRADTASGPVRSRIARATSSSGIRTATVPRVSPRSHCSEVCWRQTRVSGPGQNVLDQGAGPARARRSASASSVVAARDQHRRRHLAAAALGREQAADGVVGEGVGGDAVDGVGRDHDQLARVGRRRRRRSTAASRSSSVAVASLVHVAHRASRAVSVARSTREVAVVGHVGPAPGRREDAPARTRPGRRRARRRPLPRAAAAAPRAARGPGSRRARRCPENSARCGSWSRASGATDSQASSGMYGGLQTTHVDRAGEVVEGGGQVAVAQVDAGAGEVALGPRQARPRRARPRARRRRAPRRRAPGRSRPSRCRGRRPRQVRRSSGRARRARSPSRPAARSRAAARRPRARRRARRGGSAARAGQVLERLAGRPAGHQGVVLPRRAGARRGRRRSGSRPSARPRTCASSTVGVALGRWRRPAVAQAGRAPRARAAPARTQDSSAAEAGGHVGLDARVEDRLRGRRRAPGRGCRTCSRCGGRRSGSPGSCRCGSARSGRPCGPGCARASLASASAASWAACEQPRAQDPHRLLLVLQLALLVLAARHDAGRARG